MSTWIDFKQLRQRLVITEVLQLYNVELKNKGDRLTGFCPLPGHQGQRRSPSFSASVSRNQFQCFGCGAKGNCLDLATYLENKDPCNPGHVRSVALKLAQHFGIVTGRPENGEMAAKANAVSQLPTVVNPPLDFELKQLDYGHPYLRQRGFSDQIIQQFGLGYCNRGAMRCRIAIPLHDEQGVLVGYAGRLTDDAKVHVDNPKYRFPSSRERDGKVMEFRKNLLLYNAHRITEQVQDLIVVESFTAVWWLTQWNYPNVVALMGASCSPEQAKLILDRVHPRGCIWNFTDADAAGERCAASALTQLAPHRLCRWAKLPPGQQPTDCTVADLERLLPIREMHAGQKPPARRTVGAANASPSR